MLACSLGNRSRGILNGNPNTKLPMNCRPDVEIGSAETTRAGCSRSGASYGRAMQGCGAETARPCAALVRCSKQFASAISIWRFSW